MTDPTPPVPLPSPPYIDDPKKPWKAIVAVVVAILIIAATAVQNALTDGYWDTADFFSVTLAVLGAIGVYATPNPKVLDE